MLRKILMVLAWLPGATMAAGAGYSLDHANIDPKDLLSIQSGARTFVNYCLNCHSASSMRYNRLMDLGLTEKQIKENLMFAGAKVGDPMNIAAGRQAQRKWFGVEPPDLSVIARSRGVDWLYTYLRTFYRDETRPSGWNNLVFPNVGMPHVLWQLQGTQVLKEESEDHGGHPVVHRKLALGAPGQLSPAAYDTLVRDLVNYLAFMGEPEQATRIRTGYFVLIFLFFLLVLTWLLKKEYWKDVH